MLLTKKTIFRLIYFLVVLLTALFLLGLAVLLQSKAKIFSYSEKNKTPETATPFPVSVDPKLKTITDNPLADLYYQEKLAAAPSAKDNWWNQVAGVFAAKSWYQNLASPVSRIIVIWPGDRKEEVVKHIGDTLNWNKEERERFQNLVDKTEPVMPEGKYYPGQYVAHRKAKPEEVQKLITDSFEREILNRYTSEVSKKVPLEEALIIASLLEREASDFENKREIAGVIWNRLFKGMPLQLDATLQYAKGSRPYEPSWWPKVNPRDKFIVSPFNTYENKGLPPAPIANPSAEAVLAALNPIKTDCLYYFHDKNKKYYCSPTYEEHVKKLRSLYGRGS